MTYIGVFFSTMVRGVEAARVRCFSWLLVCLCVVHAFPAVAQQQTDLETDAEPPVLEEPDTETETDAEPPVLEEPDTETKEPVAETREPVAETQEPAAEAPGQPSGQVTDTEFDPQFERALPHIEQGEVSIEDEKYEAALADFERAYQILEGHPQRCEILFNIGLCHERLFRYNRALKFFRRYLDECGARAEKKERAEQIIDVLQHLLGTLRISVNVPAEAWVDDVMVGKVPGDLLVSGGRHTIEIRARGYESLKREVSVLSRTVRELTVELKETGSYEGVNPAYFGTTLALGVVSAGIGTYFGLQALSKSNEAENNRLEATDETLDEIDELALKADIFYAAAGVLAVGSSILFFLTDWEGEDQENPPAQTAMRLLVIPDGKRQGATLQLTDRF